MKKITLLLNSQKWTLIFFLGLFLSLNSYSRTYNGSEKIYLRPSAVSWWLNDNAKVGMYFFLNSNPSSFAWAELTSLTFNGSDVIWSANVPAGNWDRAIVTRHSVSPISWDNKWNQSDNLVIDNSANYVYSFAENSTSVTWQTLNANNYKSKNTGEWSDLTKWQASFDSSNWFDAHYLPNSEYVNVQIQNGHTITFNQNATVSGLTINSGATFTASDASPRTLTISKSASGSSTTLTNNGTWANGTGGSTVVFTGAPSSGDAIHAISGTIAFQNLTVNKTGGTSNVGASFGANSSLSGTLEIGTGGDIATNPPTGFYASGSILRFNQGASATYDVNAGDRTWSTTVIPQNITVATGKVRVNDNRTATGNLLVSPNATIELSAAIQLTIQNALTNDGMLILKSANETGTATIITNGTVSGSGTTEVEQFVSSAAMGTTGRNWYISSPLSAATSSTITSETGNGLVSWNGSAWIAAGTTMDVMKGYIARSPNGNKTIKFSGGSLNTGNQSVSNLPVGFNLVGNPYASYVDFAQATRTEVASTIWYRSKSTGSYVFQTFNTVGSIGVNGGTNTIPPMQSFWIRTTAASNAFGFTNTMRSHQNQTIAANRLKAPAVDTQQLLRLEIANGTDTDETVVYFNENAINALDDYDSQKLFNEEAGVPEIYTQTESTNLSINGLNSLQLQTEIPLGFRTGLTDQQASYQLKATKLQNFDPSIEVVLIDKFANNSEIVLTEGVAYSFTSEPVNTTQRFGLIFRTKSIITGACCFNLPDNSVQVYKNKQHQLVLRCQHQLPEHTTLRIYGLSGQLIAQQRINATETVISNALEKGIYIMQLHSNGNVYQSKIIF